MGNDFHKILGTVFLIASGVIYTAERIASNMAEAIAASGAAAQAAAHETTRIYPVLPENNLFVWIYAVIGVVLLVSGFPSGRRERPSRR
ncbi:hypothetical protein LJK88_38720 [Paenibacillus sp. P26]|nr:hypothetical protein LJK88_38720 [Paenibacillus sp. P26]UUZ93149.1 hypothetical protein LJK87_49575 [Paenibacillus sp. P25]